MDVIHTLVDNNQVDFALDAASHLLLKVDISSPRYTFTSAFSDYAEVNGIQLPRKISSEGSDFKQASFQLNVDYDEQIFSRPPRIEDGPDAWRRGGSTGARGSASNLTLGTDSAQVEAAGGPANIAALVNALDDENEHVRAEASAALTKIGASAVAPLLDRLKNCGGHPCVALAATLNELAPDNPVVTAAFLDLLKNPHADLTTRRLTAFLLAESESGVRLLAGQLKDDDAFVRRSVVFALSERAETTQAAPAAVVAALKASIPALVNTLADKDDLVSGVAAEALEKIGKDALPYLKQATNSSNPHLRLAAAEFLQQITNR